MKKHFCNILFISLGFSFALNAMQNNWNHECGLLDPAIFGIMDLKKIEDNQLIQSNLNQGFVKIENIKTNYSQLAKKLDNRFALLELICETLESLNHTKQEIEALKKNKRTMRRFHTYYMQEAFKIIQKFKQQNKSIKDLKAVIEQFRKDKKMRTNVNNSKYLD
jgi:hypothetical protein